jgi:thiol-disulfide isomerase/thioredoxin
MKLKLLSSAAILFAAVSLSFGQSASEIITKFEKEKADALDAYLKANPDAADKNEALEALIDARELVGDTAGMIPLMEQRYVAMKKGADADVRGIIDLVSGLAEAYGAAGSEDKALALFETAKKDLADHEQGVQIAKFIDSLAKKLDQPGVGDVIEIKFTSLQGEEVDLATMKDKVVLIDFWATWCGPCIGELPNVKKTYDAWHDKGFEILAISLDKEGDKEKLEKFIKDKEMPWAQMFDGKGWGTSYVEKYGINGIPATFLVGKDGKIVATNLRGPALEKTVSGLLK